MSKNWKEKYSFGTFKCSINFDVKPVDSTKKLWNINDYSRRRLSLHRRNLTTDWCKRSEQEPVLTPLILFKNELSSEKLNFLAPIEMGYFVALLFFLKYFVYKILTKVILVKINNKNI